MSSPAGKVINCGGRCCQKCGYCSDWYHNGNWKRRDDTQCRYLYADPRHGPSYHFDFLDRLSHPYHYLVGTASAPFADAHTGRAYAYGNWGLLCICKENI
ncbi:unnamed protein product [Rotaria sp. Silwood1]|nr:unnamed protein product [Rotaria sp. Silwood1]